MIVFIVSRPGHSPENVILAAAGREEAKRNASPILGGDREIYVVDPITKNGEETVVITYHGTSRVAK